MDSSEGKKGRSVLSPAAYFVDLLRLKDRLTVKEESKRADGIDERRSDIYDIPLSSENSFTEIPFLNIVNRCLEHNIENETGAGAGTAYKSLLESKYPFNLPFSRDYNRIGLSLDYLKTGSMNFYKALVSPAELSIAAREYLGLSEEEYRVITEEKSAESELKESWGINNGNLQELKDAEKFKKAAGLSGKELKELLYQNLSESEIDDKVPADFFINLSGSKEKSFLTITESDKKVMTLTLSHDPAADIPLANLDKINRFIRLSRITELSFTDLNHILVSSCGAKLDGNALNTIAALKYLSSKYELPIDELCALWSPLKDYGYGEGAEREDLFYRIFEKGFSKRLADLGADDKEALKSRITAALSLRESDYLQLMEFAGVEDGDSLRLDKAFLDKLYRIVNLAALLSLSIGEMSTIIGVIDHNWDLMKENRFEVTIPFSPKTASSAGSIVRDDDSKVEDRLWLFQLLSTVTGWLRERELSIEEFDFICREHGRDYVEGGLSESDSVELFNDLSEQLQSLVVKAGQLEGGVIDRGAAGLLSEALQDKRAPICDRAGIVTAAPSEERLKDILSAIFRERLFLDKSDLSKCGLDESALNGALKLLRKSGYLDVVASRWSFTAGGYEYFRAKDSSSFRLNGFEDLKDDIFNLLAERADSEQLELELADFKRLKLAQYRERALLEELQNEGYLDYSLWTILESKAQFLAAKSSADLFELPAYEHSKEAIFKVLNTKAKSYLQVMESLPAEALQLSQKLTNLAGRQESTLLSALENSFSLPEGTIKEVLLALFKTADEPAERAVSNFCRPILDFYSAGMRNELPTDGALLTSFHKMRRFLLLISKSELNTEEVRVLFKNRAIYERIPEKLRLPKGLSSEVDALYSDEAGDIYLFAGGSYVHYSGRDYSILKSAPLSELSGLPQELQAGIKAAFKDQDGESYLFSDDSFYSTSGKKVAKTADHWGRVRNNIGEQQRVDAGYTASNGKLYLFSGDQYVRYSGSNGDFVDEGYPLTIRDNWDKEGELALPASMSHSLDAVMQDPAGKTYFFSKGSYVCQDEPETIGSVKERFGKVLNRIKESERIDAALDMEGTLYLFSGDQYARYSTGERTFVDEGYPRKLESSWHNEKLGNLPPSFLSNIDAAFKGSDGNIYLFKDGNFVNPQGKKGEQKINESWGRVLNSIRANNRVDAALRTGDSKLYLFSGEQYVRYSTADYSSVDEGYPKRIASGWSDEGKGLIPAEFQNGLGAALTIGDNHHLFSKNHCSDSTGSAKIAINERWGKVYNNIKRNKRVDSALTMDDGRLYLFSGEQYTRYSDPANPCSDEGYPKKILANWDKEGPFDELPEAFRSGIDASFSWKNRVYLFKGSSYLSSANKSDRLPQVKEHWGRVRNELLKLNRVDASYTTPEGILFVISGDQIYRYSEAGYSTLDEGFPIRLKSYFKGLPASFESQIDAAFIFRVGSKDRLYLFKGEEYITISDAAFTAVDSGGPFSIVSGIKREGDWFKGFCVHLDDDDDEEDDKKSYKGYRALNIEASLVDRSLEKARLSIFYRDKGSKQRVKNFYYSRSSKEYKWRRLGEVEDKGKTYPFKTIDAAFYNKGTNELCYFSGNYFAGTDQAPQSIKGRWGHLTNRIEELNRVDAALKTKDGKLYLFAADQFFRYSTEISPGNDNFYLDEGYPKMIAKSWAAEKQPVALPDSFESKGHALFSDKAGAITLFSGEKALTGADPEKAIPLVERWGTVANRIRELNRVDAAFSDHSGRHFLFCDDQYVRYSQGQTPEGEQFYVDEGYPRTIETNWQSENIPLPLPAKFRADSHAIFADGRDYYLFTDNSFVSSANGRPRAVYPAWGKVVNNFEEVNRVDAALVDPATRATYLFSGDQYIKYSGGYDSYVDEGYPKRIETGFNAEGSIQLTELFNSGVEAVLADSEGAIYAFTPEERQQFISSANPGALEPTALHWGTVRNNIAADEAIDCAYTTAEGVTYLFRGDQYVKDSGQYEGYVDEGYPLRIAGSWQQETGVLLPESFYQGLDAVFKNAGKTYFVSKGEYAVSDGNGEALRVESRWGKVMNNFESGRIDAAFVAPDGKSYLFSGDQFTCYSRGKALYADEGFPKVINNHWGENLVKEFKDGIDAAFNFEGRSYLFKGKNYVRISDPACQVVDRGFPKVSAKRMSSLPELPLSEVKLYSEFKRLSTTFSGQDNSLLNYLAQGEGSIEKLSALTKWGQEPLTFTLGSILKIEAKRQDEACLELETLLSAHAIFSYAEELGTDPKSLKEQIWDRIYGATRELSRAGENLYGLLKVVTPKESFEGLEKEYHNRLNRVCRDALGPYLMYLKGFKNSNELYSHLLMDSLMNEEATTSEIKEATGVVQLFYHRALMNLEEVTDYDNENEINNIKHEDLKRWWPWMKNYRVWEANRKVFLYPETYIRPELRSIKSPAFKKLEEALLQNEITADAVSKAYNDYMDEYSDVSTLKISGGYVYQDETNRKQAVMFGHTRTEPHKYYYRLGELRDDEESPLLWKPWEATGITINAARVYPVYAFNKIFVFWVEIREKNETAFGSGQGSYSSDNADIRYEPVIKYSFYDLNKNWIAPQQLLDVRADLGKESQLYKSDFWKTRANVEGCGFIITTPSLKMDDGSESKEYVYLAYDIGANEHARKFRISGRLTSELDFNKEVGNDIHEYLTAPEGFPQRLGISYNSYTHWTSYVEDTLSAPWYTFDSKGGNFLCMPTDNSEVTGTSIKAVTDFTLIKKSGFKSVDAAFKGEGGKAILFSGDNYFEEGSSGTQPIGDRWGKVENIFSNSEVKEAITTGDLTYLFSENKYLSYEGGSYLEIEDGYPLQKTLFDLAKTVLKDKTSKSWEEFIKPAKEKATAEEVKAAIAGALKEVENLFVSKGELYLVKGAEYINVNLQNLINVSPLFDGLGSLKAAFYIPLTGENRLLLFSNGAQVVSFDPSKTDYEAKWSKVSVKEFFRAKLGDSFSFTTISTAFYGNDGRLYAFSGSKCAYFNGETLVEEAIDSKWGKAKNEFKNGLDSALSYQGKIYLFAGERYVRYSNPESTYIDEGYPKPVSSLFSGTKMPLERVDAAFVLPIKNRTGEQEGEFIDKIYLFQKGSETKSSLYIRLDGAKFSGDNPASALDEGYPKALKGSWGNLPLDYNSRIEAAYTEPGKGLYLFKDDSFVGYYENAKPYELSEVDYDIIRLTTNTAQKLKQKLFARGVDGLLSRNTQLTKELPSFSTTEDGQDVISYKPAYVNRRPEGENLDYSSANGFYYWEIFFHTPFLVAQSLNYGQKFEEAKRWFEYIFDPTEQKSEGNTERYWWKFLPFNKEAGDKSLSHLSDQAQITKYKDDPFDPHAIAQMRTVAYRKSLVMSYIDNLIDWGDMLFRQYTMETIQEARMLYILAYDLLGEKPESFGVTKLPSVKSYAELKEDKDGTRALAEEALIELENSPENAELALDAPAGETPNESLLEPYFYIPENRDFINYWNRVEDRLFKIRNSLNIDGVKQALPLFQPPINPMALVQAAAGGGGFAAALADFNVPVPHYRFSFMLAKARELTSRLTQFGSTLLSTLEKRDSEELSLLRQNQERQIMELTLDIKKDSLRNAEESLKQLKASLKSARTREQHYHRLISENLSGYEKAQIGLMSSSMAFSTLAMVFNSISSALNMAPQAGSPFALTYGGQQLGASMYSLGSSFNVASSLTSQMGNLTATLGGWDRRKQDWELQKSLASCDIEQLTHQIEGAKIQIKIAQKEIELQKRQIKHNESIDTFMKSKFTNKQLYRWIAGKLSALYFQTYQMALDLAKAAQKSFSFELALKAGEVSFIKPAYWDSLKKGLMSGEQLQVDLDRMEKAYLEKNKRRFEISKTVSLLQLDPLALLNLKERRSCEFTLGEELFDYDFPGHYCRQIKSVSLTFPAVVGPYENVNATLTQLNHRTLIEPDKDGAAYLIRADKDGELPLSIRTDWRPNQQIALSRGVNDAGLFQLNFQDERYLPFEGTGAVSTWRLELNGHSGAFDLATLSDVIVKVEYSSLQGGESFGKAVKKLLKPVDRAKLVNSAADLSNEWQRFMARPEEGLTLKLSREMFSAMSKNRVETIYMQYDLTEAGAQLAGKRLKLDGTAHLLEHGKALEKVGLSIGSEGAVLTFKPQSRSDAALFRPENIRTIGFVFIYESKPEF